METKILQNLLAVVNDPDSQGLLEREGYSGILNLDLLIVLNVFDSMCGCIWPRTPSADQVFAYIDYRDSLNI